MFTVYNIHNKNYIYLKNDKSKNYMRYINIHLLNIHICIYIFNMYISLYIQYVNFNQIIYVYQQCMLFNLYIYIYFDILYSSKVYNL